MSWAYDVYYLRHVTLFSESRAPRQPRSCLNKKPKKRRRMQAGKSNLLFAIISHFQFNSKIVQGTQVSEINTVG